MASVQEIVICQITLYNSKRNIYHKYGIVHLLYGSKFIFSHRFFGFDLSFVHVVDESRLHHEGLESFFQ